MADFHGIQIVEDSSHWLGADGGATPVAVEILPTSPTVWLEAPVGTFVADLLGVPYGVTPAIAPNDGRIVIAGNDEQGWRLVTGIGVLVEEAGKDYTISGAGIESVIATVKVMANPLPALPLAPGARIAAHGDSLSQFNATMSNTTLAVSSNIQGAMEAAVGHDPRVNFDYWYDPANPWIDSGQTIRWDGANQGIGGDHLIDNRAGRGGGILPRLAYALSRNPQIVWLNAGTNTINSGDSYNSDGSP
ncbi:MAG: hypothetical protein QM690_18720, partial [Sphingobium sp.]